MCGFLRRKGAQTLLTVVILGVTYSLVSHYLIKIFHYEISL